MLTNKGFSLIQVMVIGAALAASSVAIMKMNKNQVKANTSSAQKSNLSRYINRIDASLFNYKVCNKLVKPSSSNVVLNYNASNIGVNKPHALTSIQNKFISSSGFEMFPDDFYQYGLDTNSPNLSDYREYGWVISDMNIRRVMTTVSSKETYLDVHFLKTGQKTDGAKKIIKSFELNVEYMPNNKTFIRCFSKRKDAISTAIKEAKEEICVKDMLGVFDGPTESCTYIPYRLETSPIRKLEGGGNKTMILFPVADYDMCYLVAAGKTYSTKKRRNRDHLCEVKKNGSSWVLSAKESYSSYYCHAQCIRIKE